MCINKSFKGQFSSQQSGLYGPWSGGRGAALNDFSQKKIICACVCFPHVGEGKPHRTFLLLYSCLCWGPEEMAEDPPPFTLRPQFSPSSPEKNASRDGHTCSKALNLLLPLRECCTPPSLAFVWGPFYGVIPKGTALFLLCFLGISSGSIDNTLKNNFLI